MSLSTEIPRGAEASDILLERRKRTPNDLMIKVHSMDTDDNEDEAESPLSPTVQANLRRHAFSLWLSKRAPSDPPRARRSLQVGTSCLDIAVGILG